MPRFRYLTASYVSFLDLPVFPVITQHSVASWVSAQARKPAAAAPVTPGVHFEGHLYLMHESKLSYDLYEEVSQ